MEQINLLKSLPKQKRNVNSRNEFKTKEVINISKKYSFDYWDGDRKYGYGGYKYDGRWRSVAKDIISHYELKDNDKILDVGCGKGFLVKDLLLENRNLNVFGLDISRYALDNCPEEIIGKLHYGSADNLPFPNNSFDLVISINTIHNLNRKRASIALSEMQRVTKKNEKQKEIFEQWVLTAEFYDYPNGWIKLFNEAGYKGDYDWTIV